MNITGITAIRNFPASFTQLRFISPVRSPTKSITHPYILAGTGSGSRYLSASPTNEIASIIRNCLNNFITFLQ